MKVEKRIYEDSNEPGRKINMKPLTAQTKREIVQSCGAVALVLFEHYRTVVRYPDYVIDDNKSARATGFTERVVKNNRLRLVKEGWFLHIKSTTKNRIFNEYYLGKDAVSGAI